MSLESIVTTFMSTRVPPHLAIADAILAAFNVYKGTIGPAAVEVPIVPDQWLPILTSLQEKMDAATTVVSEIETSGTTAAGEDMAAIVTVMNDALDVVVAIAGRLPANAMVPSEEAVRLIESIKMKAEEATNRTEAAWKRISGISEQAVNTRTTVVEPLRAELTTRTIDATAEKQAADSELAVLKPDLEVKTRERDALLDALRTSYDQLAANESRRSEMRDLETWGWFFPPLALATTLADEIAGISRALGETIGETQRKIEVQNGMINETQGKIAILQQRITILEHTLTRFPELEAKFTALKNLLDLVTRHSEASEQSLVKFKERTRNVVERSENVLQRAKNAEIVQDKVEYWEFVLVTTGVAMIDKGFIEKGNQVLAEFAKDTDPQVTGNATLNEKKVDLEAAIRGLNGQPA